MTCLPAPDNSILIKTTSWQPRLGNGCRQIRVEGKFQKFILSLFNALIFCLLDMESDYKINFSCAKPINIK